MANKSTCNLGLCIRTCCLKTCAGRDHSVEITVLRDNWSESTLNVPLMWTAAMVHFSADALFHIISAMAARYVDVALFIADKAAELSHYSQHDILLLYHECCHPDGNQFQNIDGVHSH